MLSDKCTLALAAATLSAVALGSPSQAAAQDDRGFYIGLGAGQTKIQDLKELCDDLTAIGGVVRDCDDKGTGWKAFVGYQFIKYLGVELGYLDMGKGKVNVTGPGGTADVEFKANAVVLQAVGFIPLTEAFSILGRVGAARWDAETSVGATGLPRLSESDNGVSLAAGVGVQYMFTRNFGIRGEYEVFSKVGDENTTGESDIHMYGASVLFKF